MKPLECKTRDGRRAVVIRLYNGRRCYPLEVKVYYRYFFNLLSGYEYKYYLPNGNYLSDFHEHELDLMVDTSIWSSTKKR